MPLTPARFRPFALSVNYDRLKNLRPRKNIRSAMNHEIQMFACAQKEQQGLDKAVEECSASMPATTNAAPLLTLGFPLHRRISDVAVRRLAEYAHYPAAGSTPAH